MDRKIFISSTCFDLIDLRAEVFEYLKEMGITPIMSDQPESQFQTYHDTNSIETCLVNLRDSDTVIIILSQRYGPTLDKAGFGAISATHLEYLEAVKHKKPIIMFVRDRLEADYNTYKRTKTTDSLIWVKKEDIQIFEILEEHKKLVNDKNNNWFWAFKNSVDVKARLQIDLQKSIAAIRLSELIKAGNLPFVTIEPNVELTYQHAGIQFKIIAENLGNRPAIEPMIAIHETAAYDVVLDWYNGENIPLNNDGSYITSLKPNEKSKVVEFEFPFGSGRPNTGTHNFIIEVLYQNAQGDFLADVTNVKVEIIEGTYKQLRIQKSFMAKRYIDENNYKQIV